MIPPRVAQDRRRTENRDWSGGRGSPPESVVLFDPRMPEEGQHPLPLLHEEGLMMFPTLPNCPGGGAQLVPSGVSVVLVEETNAGDTSRPECPCDDKENPPLAGTNKPLGGTVSEGDIWSPCGGGGALPPSGAAGGLLPVDVADAPALSVEGPWSVSSRISVVLVDGTMAGDTP